MQAISRRSFIGKSSICLAPVLTGASIFPESSGAIAKAQVVGSVAQKSATSARDLCMWAQGSIGPLLAGARHGIPAHQDLGHASAAMRLFAKHMEASRIDRASKYIASQIGQDVTDHSPYFPVDEITTVAQRYDPTITRGRVLSSLLLTKEQTRAAHESLLANGISYQIHGIADFLRDSAKAAQIIKRHAVGFTAAYHEMKGQGHLEYQTYSKSKPARVENVSFTSACLKYLCHLLNNLILGAVGQAAIHALAGLTMAAACASVEGGSLFGEVIGGGPEDPFADIGVAGATAFCRLGFEVFKATDVLSYVSVSNLAIQAAQSAFQTTTGAQCSINPFG